MIDGEYQLTKKDWTLCLVCIGGVIAVSVAMVVMGGCSTIAGIGDDLGDVARWSGERIDNGFNRPK